MSGFFVVLAMICGGAALGLLLESIVIAISHGDWKMAAILAWCQIGFFVLGVLFWLASYGTYGEPKR